MLFNYVDYSNDKNYPSNVAEIGEKMKCLEGKEYSLDELKNLIESFECAVSIVNLCNPFLAGYVEVKKNGESYLIGRICHTVDESTINIICDPEAAMA